jgi:hypothetical protein
MVHSQLLVAAPSDELLSTVDRNHHLAMFLLPPVAQPRHASFVLTAM